MHNLLRLPIASKRGIGILTDFPSTTPFGLALGADSPCADERGAGNLGLSASGPFTRFIATHVSIRTSDTSSNPYGSPSQAYRTLSYHVSVPFNPLEISREPQSCNWRVYARQAQGDCASKLGQSNNLQLRRRVFTQSLSEWTERNAYIRIFGAQFEPRYIFRAGRLDQ